MTEILNGIIVGGTGGALAGITVSVVRFLGTKYADRRDKNRVYNWLKKNSADEPGNQFRSTRAIASWNNLTEDRVRYICSIHKKIFLSTGREEDIWGIHRRKSTSVYEKKDR